MNSNAHLCSASLCGVIPSPLNSLCRQECPCISHPLAFTSWVQVEQMCANMSGLCRAEMERRASFMLGTFSAS